MDAWVQLQAGRSDRWRLRMKHPIPRSCETSTASWACSPLLAPIFFGLPAPRRHILGVTPGLGFLGHPSAGGIRSGHLLLREPASGYPVPIARFPSALGLHYPPGFVGVIAGHTTRCQPLALSVWTKPVSPLACYASRRFTCAFTCVSQSSLLEVAPPWAGSLAPFHPALEIDVQSLLQGWCRSFITRRVGNCAQHRAISCQGCGQPCDSSPGSRRFRVNGSHCSRA